MNKKALLLAAFAAIFTAQSQAAPFTPGDIAVDRVGDGASALTSNGTAMFIDEYTPTGQFVQSIAVPSTGSNALTDSATASSDGELTLSTNGQFLVFTGYDAVAGTTGVASSTTIPRGVGTVNVLTGAVDTSTQLSASSTYSGNNIRGAASVDGTSFWLAGNGSSSSNSGVRYATLGATTSTTIETTVGNTRAVGIYNGQLYTSSGSSSTFGVYSVGSGLPTTSGQTTTQLPPGSEFTASVAYTGFYISPDGTRLFVSTGASTNSIQEFVLNAGNWALDKSLNVNGSFQLTGTTAGNITTLFYTLNSGTAGNSVDTVSFNSTTDAFSSTTLLATAGANESFRGLAILPVPEPPTWAFMISGFSLLFVCRRFFRRA